MYILHVVYQMGGKAGVVSGDGVGGGGVGAGGGWCGGGVLSFCMAVVV